MPRGQPDYGMYGPRVTAATLSDMAELAARLGSIVTFDRRGRVIDYDDFGAPILKWETAGTAGFHDVYLDSASTKSSSQACRLEVSDLAGAFALINRWIAAQGSQKIGVEFSFSNMRRWCNLDIGVEFCSGGVLYSAYLRIDPIVNRALYILDAGAAWRQIATFREMQMYPFTFYTAKLVADFERGNYERIVLGEQEYDISAEGLFSIAYNYFPFISSYAILRWREREGEVWVDDYVLTQEEP